MMNGLPVVASDIPSDRKPAGEPGADPLLPGGDSAGAAAAITRLAGDVELRRALGKRGWANA